jgi:stage V sporulation protein SpoVS
MRRKAYRADITANTIEEVINKPGHFKSLVITNCTVSAGEYGKMDTSLVKLLTIANNGKDLIEKLTIRDARSLKEEEHVPNANIIKDFINNSKTLKEIIFDNINLSDSYVGIISNAIAKSTSLIYITFKNCQLNAACATYLAEALKVNTTISELEIRGNQIADLGVIALAQGLKENKILTSLHLGSNAIGDEGVKALAGLIAESNTKLSILYLENNNIGDLGAEYLVAALAVNKNINSLCLTKNYISKKGIDALKEVGVATHSLSHQHQAPIKLNQQSGAKEAEISELAELKAKLEAMEKKWGEAEQKAAETEKELLKVKEENTALAQKLKNYEQQAVSAPVEIVPADDNADDIGSILERLKKSVSLDQGTEQPGAEGTQTLGENLEHVD